VTQTKVIQWGTGVIGRTCLRTVLDHPDLELVGVRVYSESKAGRDAGDIARYPDAGVIATLNTDEILDLDADVVIHAPRLQLPYERHDEDLCRLLASGKNVITTAGHHYPAAHGAERAEMFQRACAAGNSTLYGVGLNPGFVLERLILGLTGVCTSLDSITVNEFVDTSTVPSTEFVFDIMGMGSDPEDPQLLTGPLAELYGKLYREPMELLAKGLGVQLESIESDHEAIAATSDLDLPAGLIKKGQTAATTWRWHGYHNGRRLLTLGITWAMDLDLIGASGADHWLISIDGKPGLALRLDLVEAVNSPRKTKAGQYGMAGLVVNSIPAVCAAPPGVLEPVVFAPFSLAAWDHGQSRAIS
jgi:hypothetical protein